MSKGRLEAFSDGVIAIIITIMVMEMKAPASADWSALHPMIPVFLSYALSFVFLGIYWNNHHHLFQAVKHVNGTVLWANLHLLFWLSMVPFATAWMGENHFEPSPVALYGFVLLFAAIAYYILARTLVTLHGQDSTLAVALGADFKGKISIVIYVSGILFSYFNPVIANLLYIAVAIMWLVPDKRIEKILSHK